MENATEALKMAGAVLIFVLAISIIILAFGQVRATSDIILSYKDRETEYINDEENRYYGTTTSVRTVSLETVIPSIFRAYLENYKIVFEGLTEPLYKIKNKDGIWIDKYTLDLETNQDKEYRNVVLGTDEQKKEFIRGVLYHDFNDLNKIKFNEKFFIQIGETSLYQQLIR